MEILLWVPCAKSIDSVRYATMGIETEIKKVFCVAVPAMTANIAELVRTAVFFVSRVIRPWARALCSRFR